MKRHTDGVFIVQSVQSVHHGVAAGHVAGHLSNGNHAGGDTAPLGCGGIRGHAYRWESGVGVKPRWESKTRTMY